MVIKDDYLFCNAGMNQFQDIILGNVASTNAWPTPKMPEGLRETQRS